MQNLFESPPVQIRELHHRVAVKADGAIAFEFRDHAGAWHDHAGYCGPRFGLITRHDLHHACYEPHRAAIEAAREGTPALQRYTLSELAERARAQSEADKAEHARRLRALADAMAGDFELVPYVPKGDRQFNLI